jgi:large subunit ribosomal protein L18
MYKVRLYKDNRIRRKLRVKKKIEGTPLKPRMTVFRSNTNMYVQMIDDDSRRTLFEASSMSKGFVKKGKKKSEQAFEVGKLVAKKSLEKGIKEAVFDRNGYRYHGRVRSVADGAREGGLKI